MQKAISFNDVAIAYVKGSAYRIHFWYMSKNDAISLMNNSILINKMGALCIYFFNYMQKMSNANYYKKNRDVILNRVKDYYENNKKVKRASKI